MAPWRHLVAGVRARTIAVAYCVLLVAKVVYATIQTRGERAAWEASCLFAYNDRADFEREHWLKLGFGLAPYLFLGMCGVLSARRAWVSVGCGILLAIADVGVDYHYRASRGAQVGVAILLVYSAFVLAILLLYGLVNLALERDDPTVLRANDD